MQCLLLNAAMQPLRIINWQRAVTLFFNKKVNIIANYPNQVLRSPIFHIDMPAVVALKSYVNPYKHKCIIPSCSRYTAFVRDRFTCQYCGKKFQQKNLTIDHVIPRCKGGKTEWNNIVTACRKCNEIKQDKFIKDSGLTLLRKPAQPKNFSYVLYQLGNCEVKEIWKQYLL